VGIVASTRRRGRVSSTKTRLTGLACTV
jgi:hypothetical protein